MVGPARSRSECDAPECRSATRVMAGGQASASFSRGVLTSFRQTEAVCGILFRVPQSGILSPAGPNRRRVFHVEVGTSGNLVHWILAPASTRPPEARAEDPHGPSRPRWGRPFSARNKSTAKESRRPAYSHWAQQCDTLPTLSIYPASLAQLTRLIAPPRKKPKSGPRFSWRRIPPGDMGRSA